jgi:predicted outer membrane repeat protein
MTITGSTFTGNNATGLGGAISNYGTDLRIANSTFINNTANYGGAISNSYDANYGYHGPFTVTSCTFTGNSARTYGSVIYNGRDSETYEVHFNTIYGNTGNYDIYSAGGAINAENNWWGDNFNETNPKKAGRANSNVDADPWIVLKVTAYPTSISLPGTSNINADLGYNSNGEIPDGTLPDGTVTFAVNELGNLNLLNGTINSTNNVTTTFTPTKYGTALITTTLDGFSVINSVYVGVSTSLTVNGTSGYKGDNTTLTATLWDTAHNKAIQVKQLTST